MTLDSLEVQSNLFRGTMYFPTTVLDTVVQNCQNTFKRIFKLVSILVLGVYKMDEGSEINLSMTNEGSRFLEFLYTLYKSMQECMVNQNCVHYVRQIITPYGSNLSWLLLENLSTKDVGDLISRFFQKSYSKDLRLLEE